MYKQTKSEHIIRASAKMQKLISTNIACVIHLTNPISDHLLESSRWGNSNKWSSIGFGEEIGILEIEVCTLSGALNTCNISSRSRQRLSVTISSDNELEMSRIDSGS